MQIQLNGAPYTTTANISLDKLVDQLNMPNQRFAIEVNAELIPRSLYAQHCLQPDDQIEVVQAIGGG